MQDIPLNARLTTQIHVNMQCTWTASYALYGYRSCCVCVLITAQGRVLRGQTRSWLQASAHGRLSTQQRHSAAAGRHAAGAGRLCGHPQAAGRPACNACLGRLHS